MGAEHGSIGTNLDRRKRRHCCCWRNMPYTQRILSPNIIAMLNQTIDTSLSLLLTE